MVVQFKRFRVNNRGHVAEAHLYYSCVLSRDVLLKKNVDISCSPLENWTVAATIEATSKICPALRCSSFTYFDQQEVTPSSRIITGDAEVVNLR